MVLWVFAPAHITAPAEPGGIGKPACAVPPGMPPFNSNPQLHCRKAGKPALRKRSAGFLSFSAFFCGGRHSDDKAHCTRFVQCASCKEWGVQPQSATSRLPIQRKGEREIAESEGAKSINIHVNCFLIKFWASIFQKSINSLSNFGKVRLTGDIHHAVLFVKIGIRHVLTADFRESQVTSTDSYVSVSSDCRFLRVLAELSLTMQEICRNCRHRIRIHSRERSQSWHRRSAVRCNSTRTVVGERILSGGGVMIRKNQPPASWNKGGRTEV